MISEEKDCFSQKEFHKFLIIMILKISNKLFKTNYGIKIIKQFKTKKARIYFLYLDKAWKEPDSKKSKQNKLTKEILMKLKDKIGSFIIQKKNYSKIVKKSIL